MRATAAALTFALLASLTLLSCSSPSAPMDYERIVVDTFSANENFTADTYLRLFDSSGNLLASADDGSAWPTMARIDYSSGLNSGTYYIRVQGNIVPSDEWYAIRVLSPAIGEIVSDHDYLTYPLALAAKPDAQETDDDPPAGSIPTSPVSISIGDSNALGRSLYHDGTTADIDWFVLVLP